MGLQWSLQEAVCLRNIFKIKQIAGANRILNTKMSSLVTVESSIMTVNILYYTLHFMLLQNLSSFVMNIETE